MFCEYCGNEIEDDSLFCDACGKPVVSENIKQSDEITEIMQTGVSAVQEQIEETLRCKNCGSELEADALFCENCGYPVLSESCENNIEIAQPATIAISDTVSDSDINSVQPDARESEQDLAPISAESNETTEQTDEIKRDFEESNRNRTPFTMKNLFSQVFKRHTSQERSEILKAGIVETVELPHISSENLQPWLYSRVFLILLAVFAIFEVCLMSFDNSNMMPVIMLIGSLLMPFSILTLYFELNAYKDISFYSVIGIFLLGGAVSLLFTLFLYTVVPMGDEMNFLTASLISVVEEIGKAVVAVLMIKRHKNATVLQGLLIGGAVGCGFAVFESAGYAFNVFLDAHDWNQRLGVYNSLVPWYYQRGGYADSLGQMNFNIFLRAVLAFGGHTAWAAIEGASFANEKKVNGNFIKMFLLCFILHAIWDTDTPAAYLKLGALCLAAWYTIIRQINKFVQNNGTKAN